MDFSIISLIIIFICCLLYINKVVIPFNRTRQELYFINNNTIFSKNIVKKIRIVGRFLGNIYISAHDSSSKKEISKMYNIMNELIKVENLKKLVCILPDLSFVSIEIEVAYDTIEDLYNTCKTKDERINKYYNDLILFNK